MSRPQQPSIMSFFRSKQQQRPVYASPPGQNTPPLPPPPPAPTPISPSALPPFHNTPAPISQLSDTAASAPAATPHPNVSIIPITETHIPSLRRINALLLPVNYTDSFYKAALDPAVSGTFSRAIIWHDTPNPQPDAAGGKVIGGIVCRVEPSPFFPVDDNGLPKGVEDKKEREMTYAPHLVDKGSVGPVESHALYIQSLVLLGPYRSLGLAGAALDEVIRHAQEVTRDESRGLNIDWVYAHVWTENEDGLRWYARRGFEKDMAVDGYYFKLRPDSAWVVKRSINPGSARIIKGPNGVAAAAQSLNGFKATKAPPPQITKTPSATPPPSATGARPALSSSLSFQNKRAATEWNDLPADMMSLPIPSAAGQGSLSRSSSRSGLLSTTGDGPTLVSGSSSRSTSTNPGRKKRDRAYPTAAFGT